MKPSVNCCRADQMPAPDTAIVYGEQEFAPAMFHYAPEGSDLREIADSNGFDIHTALMQHELPADHPLMLLYEDGEGIALLAGWEPKSPGQGWNIAGLYDTEAGPVAIFLRKRP
jgi:hypothetical protein